jgi:hypothetical protein
MSGLAFDSDVPLEYEEDTMEEESLAWRFPGSSL